MEKEFKFWDFTNNKFIDDLLITQAGKPAYIDCFENFNTYSSHTIKPIQWIGLKDCKDIKIFEYDIVKYKNRLWIVRYKPNVASFVLSNKKDCIYFNVFDTENIKIVGNKFKNPELYKKVRK